ncbi:MAG: hypothetical protein ACOCYN_00320 [Planctomycetota bacterium]
MSPAPLAALLRLLLLSSVCLGQLVAAVSGPQVQGPQIEGRMLWIDPVGYTPVMVRIHSAVPLELTVRATSRFSGASAKWDLPAGSHQRTLLLPPGMEEFWPVTLSWRSASGLRGSSHLTASGAGADIVFVGQLDMDQRDRLAQLIDRRYWGRGRSSARDRVLQFEAGDLPDRWQGFPPWMVVVIGEQMSERLSAAQRQALGDWVRAGGTLAVFGPSSTTAPDDAWSRAGIPVCRLSWSGANHEGVRACNQTAQTIRRHSASDIEIPGVGEVPVGGFILLALAFIVLIGPVNFWYLLWRRAARHLLLVSIPVISLITCIALVVFNLFSEGLHTRRTVDSYTWLDAPAHRAVRWTGISYYAPFGHSQVAVGLDTAVLPGDPGTFDDRRRHRYGHDGRSWRIDWDGSQQLSGQLVPTRRSARLHYVTVEAARERLQLSAGARGYTLLNGLGTRIEQLHYVDPKGRHWACDAVEPGASIELVALSREPRPLGGAARLGPGAAASWQRAANKPGFFQAVLASPLADIPGPAGETVTSGRHLLAGPLVAIGGAS